MNFFKWLTGTPKAVETGLNIAEKATTGVINGIDAAWFTDEEKSQANQKTQETILEFWKTFATENSEQSKARRDIANLLVKLYVAVVLIGIGMIAFHENAMLDKLVSLLNAVYFGLAFISIIGTYFVPHQVSKIWTNKKEK